MAPTGKTLGRKLGAGLPDEPFKVQPWKNRLQLTEDYTVSSMVRVLADGSSALFKGAYGGVVAFIGLFGGFLTGSEASTITS
jgi:hypothetical protein